jgi:hypothetical protein
MNVRCRYCAEGECIPPHACQTYDDNGVRWITLPKHPDNPLQDAIQRLERNIAGLTGAVEKLAQALPERHDVQEDGVRLGAFLQDNGFHVHASLRDHCLESGPDGPVWLGKVKRGPVTDKETYMAYRMWEDEELGLREVLTHFAKSRGLIP